MTNQRGLGKFEFAVVLIIIGILAGLLLNRVIELEEETERLEVELTLRHINIGLKLAIGEHLMQGNEARIAELLHRNPLDFLGDSEKVGAGATAAWRYEAQTRTLSYQPRQPAAFDGQTQLQWRFVGHRDELGRMVGLRLEALK
jgi:hypothetical protein